MIQKVVNQHFFTAYCFATKINNNLNKNHTLLQQQNHVYVPIKKWMGKIFATDLLATKTTN